MFQGTSGGEPRTLLNALQPMLGTTGEIRTPDDVVKMIRYSSVIFLEGLYHGPLKPARENTPIQWLCGEVWLYTRRVLGVWPQYKWFTGKHWVAV